MSFRLGSFIQAVSEQTYFTVEARASAISAETDDQKRADHNPPDAQAEDTGSDRPVDYALEKTHPKA